MLTLFDILANASLLFFKVMVKSDDQVGATERIITFKPKVVEK